MTGTGRLTRAQAHRLIETYGYSGPREPAVDRLTTAELFIFSSSTPCAATALNSTPTPRALALGTTTVGNTDTIPDLFQSAPPRWGRSGTMVR